MPRTFPFFLYYLPAARPQALAGENDKIVYFRVLILLCTDACDAPLRYESMKLKGASQTTYNPGDKVEYECRPGYMHIIPLLPTIAVCQDDNTWTPLQEACTSKETELFLKIALEIFSHFGMHILLLQ